MPSLTSIIPDELVSLAAENRLIPFLGAGFSADMELPGWEQMLRAVHEKMQDGLTFDQLLNATNKDYLQVAEYLYLRHDRQIGPIRQQIERSFSSQKHEPIESAAHVELVNLGAKQIYTTNYDDLVESTYSALGIDYKPVILPKDVALADSNTTQIVKYHGDLAHERTLVLTESSYFKRLDFESPMDLKFRSDLLGKSVLFMGYSFRDVNIRIIWFKLMDMMRDIPEADRRQSYIIRLEANPVLEELYAAVGLKTIVLPNSKEESGQGSPLARFLFDLSMRASQYREHNGTEGAASGRVFVSREAVRRANILADRYGAYPAGRFPGTFMLGASDPSMNRMFTGFVPEALRSEWNEAVVRLLPFRGVDEASLTAISALPPSTELTQFVVQVLGGIAQADIRAAKRKLLAVPEFWEKIWSKPLMFDRALDVMKAFVDEIRYQASEGADEDIAYLADLALRLRDGILQVDAKAADLRSLAGDALELAAETYPSVMSLEADAKTPPRLDEVLAQVESRRGSITHSGDRLGRHYDAEKWYALYERVADLGQNADRRAPRVNATKGRRPSR